MPVEIKSPKLPDLNRPQHPTTDTQEYRNQNGSAMSQAIAQRAEETADSLQALNNRLEQFENRFALATVDRIESVPVRIEQKIAQLLQDRKETREKPQIVEILDAFTVPEFALPQAASLMGALPAAY